MPVVAPTVWTARRKWLGNVVPALIWLPLTVTGVVFLLRDATIGVIVLGVATVCGWLMVNFFGLFENSAMRRQLSRILDAKGEPHRDAVFVGIATPRYSSALDPHEDVGFLRIFPDRLSFVSETRVLELYREQVQRVRFRWNIHTLLLLGRWVSVEGSSDGKPIRLMIEPREKRTMIGNLAYSKRLRQRLKRWMMEEGNA